MKVRMMFEWDDEDREQLSRYLKAMYDKPVPRLATREMIRDFVQNALDNQQMHMGDVLAGLDELYAGT